MPTYEYLCQNCGQATEAVQRMSDPALVDCPACGEPTLRKQFTNVGVVFKGSGFYRTDSRKDGASSGSSSSGSSSSGSSSSGSSGSSGESSSTSSTPSTSTSSTSTSSSTSSAAPASSSSSSSSS